MKPRGRDVHAPNRARTFCRTMPVRSSTRHEPEEICERGDSLHVFGHMAWMFYLDAIEPKLDEPLKPLPPAILSGMCPYSDRSGRVSELDGLGNLESRLWYEAGTSSTEVAIECFA